MRKRRAVRSSTPGRLAWRPWSFPAVFRPAPTPCASRGSPRQLGYARVWLYDSPLLYPDVWMTLARVAATRRIGLGTGVLVPSLRHVAAQAVGDRDARAARTRPRRGRDRHRLHGPAPARQSRRSRGAPSSGVHGALRALLRGDTVSVDGTPLRMLHPAGFAPARPIAHADPRRGERAERPRGGARARRRRARARRSAGRLRVVRGRALGHGARCRARRSTSPRAFDALAPAIALLYHASLRERRRRRSTRCRAVGHGARRSSACRPTAATSRSTRATASRATERDAARTSRRRGGADVHGHARRAAPRALRRLEAAGRRSSSTRRTGPTRRASCARWPRLQGSSEARLRHKAEVTPMGRRGTYRMCAARGNGRR